ncbi:MAG: protein kinase, partial [Chlamydiota bacterium]
MYDITNKSFSIQQEHDYPLIEFTPIEPIAGTLSTFNSSWSVTNDYTSTSTIIATIVSIFAGICILKVLTSCLKKNNYQPINRNRINYLKPPIQIQYPLEKEKVEEAPYLPPTQVIHDLPKPDEFEVAYNLFQKVKHRSEVFKLSRRKKNRLKHSYFVIDDKIIVRQMHGTEPESKGFIGEGGFKRIYKLLDSSGKATHVRCVFNKRTKISKTMIKALSVFRDKEHLLNYHYFEYQSSKRGNRKCGLICQYFDTDLEAWSQNGKPKSLYCIISVMLEIALGIEEMHQDKYAHLDIKPNNCLANTADGMNLERIRVADFDLMKNYSWRPFKTPPPAKKPPLKGTLDYAAPELFLNKVKRGSSAAYSCDIFSLGKTYRRIMKTKDLLDYDENDKAVLHDLIWKMCSFRSKERPNIEEVIKTLEQEKSNH